MTGWVANAWPAVAVGEGWMWIASLLAAAELMRIGLLGAEARPAPVNWRVIVPATSSYRSVNVARPPTRDTVVVPFSGPAPPARMAVTTVVLSPLTRLPYWSSSRITGWIAKAAPAAAVADGCVRMTRVLGVEGLTVIGSVGGEDRLAPLLAPSAICPVVVETRSVNEATPAAALTVIVPPSEPGPPTTPMVMAPANEVSTLPNGSWASTVAANELPAMIPPGGRLTISRVDAGA